MIMAKVTQGFCFWHKWITERDAGITQYQRCSRCGGRRILQGDTGYQPIDYGYLFHEQPVRLPERETGLTEGTIKSNVKPPTQREKPRVHPAAHPHRLGPGEQPVVDSIRSEIPALMASDLVRRLNALTETYGSEQQEEHVIQWWCDGQRAGVSCSCGWGLSHSLHDHRVGHDARHKWANDHLASVPISECHARRLLDG